MKYYLLEYIGEDLLSYYAIARNDIEDPGCCYIDRTPRKRIENSAELIDTIFYLKYPLINEEQFDIIAIAQNLDDLKYQVPWLFI